MDSPFLLPSELNLELLDYELYPDRIDLQVISTNANTCRPVCGQLSHKTHSCYGRIIHDLPAGGRRVQLQIQAKKYFCKNADCPRKIFISYLYFAEVFSVKLNKFAIYDV